MTTLTAPPLAAKITAADLALMDDAVGYELVDGQLRERNVSRVSSRIGMRIGHMLCAEVGKSDAGEVYGTDLGYQCFPPESTAEIRKPDASFIRKERLASLRGDVGYMPIPADLIVEVLSPNDLVVEVLSPNDLIYEVNEKVEEYLAAGFPLVWVVDPPRKTVMIHRIEGSVTKLHEIDEITGELALPAFRCRVAELFA
jgi:Uma2 family endonuclease